MPSQSYARDLNDMLQDALDLVRTHTRLRTGPPAGRHSLPALNRAVVVAAVSAWESYLESLVRESARVLHPGGAALGVWQLWNTFVDGQVKRFHTPDANNARNLLSSCLGIPDVTTAWAWAGTTPAQAVQELNIALTNRHRIAHGVNPRPAILSRYAAELPGFFRQLGLCTDAAVRAHLIAAHGLVKPWPP